MSGDRGVEGIISWPTICENIFFVLMKTNHKIQKVNQEDISSRWMEDEFQETDVQFNCFTFLL